MKKSCFFIGHANIPGRIEPMLFETIERHILAYGVTCFVVGNHGAFDSMAVRVLSKMKKKYPDILNYLALAYHPAVQPVETPAGFDGTFYPEGQESIPPRFAIPRLNRRMVREADYLIAYVCHISSGSYKLLEYASALEKRGLIIITNLADGKKIV